MERKSLFASIPWIVILVYVLLGGGLSALAVFLATFAGIDPALTLALLFTGLGSIAYLFLHRYGGRGWRWLAWAWWLSALVSAFIYVMIVGWVHPALGIAVLCFVAGGLLLYLLNRRNDADARALKAAIDWRRLGEDHPAEHVDADELTPAEREVAPRYTG